MRQFSDPHLAALFVMVVAAAGSVFGARRHPGAWEVPFARALALVIGLAMLLTISALTSAARRVIEPN